MIVGVLFIVKNRIFGGKNLNEYDLKTIKFFL